MPTGTVTLIPIMCRLSIYYLHRDDSLQTYVCINTYLSLPIIDQVRMNHFSDANNAKQE